MIFVPRQGDTDALLERIFALRVARNEERRVARGRMAMLTADAMKAWHRSYERPRRKTAKILTFPRREIRAAIKL